MSRYLFAVILSCLNLGAASETLRYNVNWPSGLSLGEATLIADNLDASAAGRRFELRLDASVPGFAVADEIISQAKPDYCSILLEKKLKHGSRKNNEKLEFKPDESIVERTTDKGGKSQMNIGNCGRDALAMVYFLRSELQQGRVPSAQTVFFGSAYQLTFKYLGATSVTIGSVAEQADKMQISIQGPASKNSLEIFFGRDPMRTPLLFRVPLVLGSFAMELQR
ncbi:DUF3108 domain-containing protein [Bryobacter aggregatus]|uniref:DUF3108 domain-containing protein n=1 Tax=Bryobacter aggregatus TaxID=360054 RepID=UPI0004E27A91|nr:DUF3108 domain-containing protein [Bryobacter aggregatus]